MSGSVPFFQAMAPHPRRQPDEYRGQHPAYWAQVEGDRDSAGVTVHLVDEGVELVAAFNRRRR